MIVATLLREKGDTGIQTHFNMFRAQLSQLDKQICVVTPFDYSKIAVFPLFGIGKLLSYINGPLYVAWYRYWHYLLLR
ncbi:MAG: hypothetical protein GTO51_07275, partial [Candidatus Latescibacteria bacterium]|nr:hypothetical protein [Candidatus Latescibacterota bacterium]NIM65774.1 hypothetical protein [Candidatus Latescibacterota bacterium]NIO02269.1 hypothetical protein [Candidatus Latescibacterota bacterium]NIO29137.1 hypothetical protein [Candidatus Latescibacterota bacterium]NIT02347.1 hypothetical protein [Candidatus Latescibacterota bacterium]